MKTEPNTGLIHMILWFHTFRGEISRDSELILSHHLWTHPILPRVLLLSSLRGVHTLPQEISLAQYTGENSDIRRNIGCLWLNELNHITKAQASRAGTREMRMGKWGHTTASTPVKVSFIFLFWPKTMNTHKHAALAMKVIVLSPFYPPKNLWFVQLTAALLHPWGERYLHSKHTLKFYSLFSQAASPRKAKRNTFVADTHIHQHGC